MTTICAATMFRALLRIRHLHSLPHNLLSFRVINFWKLHLPKFWSVVVLPTFRSPAFWKKLYIKWKGYIPIICVNASLSLNFYGQWNFEIIIYLHSNDQSINSYFKFQFLQFRKTVYYTWSTPKLNHGYLLNVILIILSKCWSFNELYKE